MTTSTYARGTEVTANRSRDEIERTLDRFGATEFAYGRNGAAAFIACQVRGRAVRFVLPLPNKGDFEYTDSGRARTSQKAIDEAYDQAVREQWRALALIIKAKLVAVQSGVVSFEQEMLPYFVLPGGRTVGETIIPQLDQVGELPSIIPPLLLSAPE